MASPICWAQSDLPQWAVDPAQPESDAPPIGRSLFDFVVTVEAGSRRVYDVPFPFEQLVRRLESRAGCAPRKQCAQQVLIPLGRSLQRLAPAPEFFKYPRIVTAINTDAVHDGGPLLKDRVYLGYQEKAGLIEVISYNEAAGRFEFQIVRDYRTGGQPQVVYARRALCAACHQNLAPIFSRQLWEETNANPRVAALLERERTLFHGVPVRRGVDVPDAIDAATERANGLAVWQRLWSEGCGGNDARGTSCRAAAFTAALQYRLTGERAYDDRSTASREALQALFTSAWRERWPGGLAMPNPDIPNRDPLPFAPGREPRGAAASHVAARFEPLAPRPPLEILSVDRPDTVRRFVAGLAGFMASRDIRALDAHLSRVKGAEHLRYEAPCEITWTERWLRFNCASARSDSPQALRLRGRIDLGADRLAGEVNALAAGGKEPLESLAIRSGVLDRNGGRLRFGLASDGMRARLSGGSAIGGIELRWRPRDVRSLEGMKAVAAQALVDTIDDFALVRAAIAELASQGIFAARPFGRAALLPALFARLGLPAREWCCIDDSSLPAAVVEAATPPAPPDEAARPYAAFFPQCANCHATGERFPPNFLSGPGERIAASVRQCAPRIYARLAMWRVAPGAREKTPMPPPLPSLRAADASAPALVAVLERAVGELLREEQGSLPRLDQLLAGGYEALRPCLPEER